VDAEVNSQRDCSTIGIAIIDTGLAYGHPDLNIAGGVSYVTGVSSANDDNGHGTHVGGIAAAVNNGSGIRGVAPNARLFAVKVLDASGSGSLSAILSGIDWVTRNASAKGIKVANMSLGFEGSSSSLNTAIHNSIAAGVVYIVAAGNSARDATTFSPANHAEVICVSAIADSDGKCGGLGSWTGYGYDDTFASFSNYGAVVDIAAPGVNIYSTYVNGQYATMSGTSMAAPHVAGAAALYLSKYPTTTPATVRSILIQRATPQLMAPTVDGTRTRGGFTGDFDGSSEPLLDAANL
jgi:subtilisin